MKRIAIDIDGVLNRVPEEILQMGKGYFGREAEFTGTIEDYKLYRLFGVTKEEENEFWEEYTGRILYHSTVQPYAADAIRQMKSAGAEIIILTSRSAGGLGEKRLQQATKRWLSKNGILYDRLVFEKRKAEFCKINSISFAVEDNPELILEYRKEGINVVGFEWYFNKGLKGVPLAKDWVGIEEVLMSWMCAECTNIIMAGGVC